MTEKPSKLQPALIGGLVLGLLASLPIVNIGNFCCCLWALLGGAIGARMLIKRSPVLPVTTGDGAAVGALAGVVGSGLNLVIGVPLGLLVGKILERPMMEWLSRYADNHALQEPLRQMMEQLQDQPLGERVIGALVNWIIFSGFFIVFAALGGVIGVSLFEKRKGQQPPGGQAPY